MVSSDNDKPAKANDAVSRRKKRRGKDEEPNIAVPRVSCIFCITLIEILSFMYNFSILFLLGTCNGRESN